MAPLNPYAPPYEPAAHLPPVEYYSPSPHVCVSRRPPFQFSFNESPLETSIFCSISSPSPIPGPYDGCYATHPFTLQTFFGAKDLGCMEGVHQPLVTSVPFPSFLQQEKIPTSFVAEEVGEIQSVTSATQTQEVVKEAKVCWRAHQIWRQKVSRGVCDNGRRRTWAPKHRSRNKPPLLTLGDEFEFKEQEEVGEGVDSRTTIMIKNLPSKLNKWQLIELLDKHCCEENQKLGQVEGMANTISEYDFLYLPMDFDRGSNLGYAFVNFTTAIAAKRLHRAYHKREWDPVLGSRKIREVNYARIQGLPRLLKHFRNSAFDCDNEEYLPVFFNPSRNGACKSEHHYVGRRMPTSRRPTA